MFLDPGGTWPRIWQVSALTECPLNVASAIFCVLVRAGLRFDMTQK